MRKKTPAPEFYGTTSAANEAGVAEQTMRNKFESGEIPAQRNAAGRWLVRRDDLLAYLKRRKAA